MDAKQGQGYIVMNQATTPYSCWRYSFQERTGKPHSKYMNGVVPLDNITVCGKDYVQIPIAYRFAKSRDIIVSIYGSTRGGVETAVIVNKSIGDYTGDPKIGTDAPVYVARCGAACDGNYQGQAYAYRFMIYEKTGGTGGSTHMKVEPVSAMTVGDIPVPYYGFYSITDATAYINSRGITGTIGQYMNTQNGQNSGISPLLNTSSLVGVIIKTPSGIPISGFYYMIPKDLGKWRNYSLYLNKPNYGYDANNCQLPGNNASLELYTSEMNNYINSLIPTTPMLAGWSNLACYGNGWSISGGDNLIDPCKESATETFYGGGANLNLWSFLAAMGPCGQTSGATWGPLGKKEIHKLSGAVSDKPIWSHDGDPQIGETISLEVGLYKLKIQFSDGSYNEFVFEVKSNTVFTTKIKDVVQTLIYPDPIINDNFSISIETPIDVSIKYELWDNRGNQLISQMITVSKNTGAPVSIPINSPLPIPSGNLINKFIYSDGSISTINSMK